MKQVPSSKDAGNPISFKVMLCLSLKFEVTIFYSNENAQYMSSGGAETLILTLLKYTISGSPIDGANPSAGIR